MGTPLIMMIMSLLKVKNKELTLVAIPLQMKMSFLWIVLEDPSSNAPMERA